MTKIITLAAYGKQRNLTRQRIYQIQKTLNIVEAPIYALINGEYISTGTTQKFILEK